MSQGQQPPVTSFSQILALFKSIDVKLISDWITLLLKIGGGIGALLLVAYAAKEHFFYDLTSFATVSLLLLMALAFSFLVIAASLYSAVSFVWLVALLFWIISRLSYQWLGHQPRVRLRPAISKWRIGFSVVLFLLLAGTVSTSKQPTNWPLVLWAVSIGFLISSAVCTEPIVPASANVFLQRILMILVLLIVMPFMFRGVFTYLLDRSMILLNFRSDPNQYVVLGEQSYRQVSALANTAGIQVSSCELRKDMWLLRGVILVWHGTGTTSYLRITGRSGQSLLIPLPSSEVGAIFASLPKDVGGCAATGK